MKRRAELIYRLKQARSGGAIVEAVIWKLPQPDADRPDGYKYRLFYGRPGERIIGYDNERGKGDHRHGHGHEQAYQFTTVDQLLADFLMDVQQEENRDANSDDSD